jgi:hypothetical protein
VHTAIDSAARAFFRWRNVSPTVNAAIFLSLICVATLAVGAGATEVTPETVWNQEARSSMPRWVQAWIYFMFLAFGSGLFFVRRHSEAWWMVGAFAASHLASGLEILLLGPERLTVGIVSINHCIFWTPATVLFARKTRTTPFATPFGAWRAVVIGTAVFSLAFDYRDAFAFLRAST